MSEVTIEKGTLLRVQTKTFQDVFGECLYEVVDTGIKPPEKGREDEMDGVKCVMLGGSGPAASEGRVIIDSEMTIRENVKTGVTTIEPASKKSEIMAVYADKALDGKPRSVRHGGAGVVELD
jgi:hypothetical protein